MTNDYPDLVLHGHFYQPPRENPWTGEIDVQPSAAPFRDWNARIHAECYHPNAFAHLPTEHGDLLVNNFERISHNVGPTLLNWLERHRPETYWRILDADRRSLQRLGHGNAIAQSYHHTILPLSDERDVRTQIIWGLADFRSRYGRESEGMWLPETAASDEVLDTLIEVGVSFTILAPWQAGTTRSPEGDFKDADTDITSRAFRYEHSDGSARSIALFFYDGGLAHSIAFDNAASSAEDLIDKFVERGGQGGLVHAATDGETYGHHWRFADLGLAYALFSTAPERGIDTTNYGAHLAAHPPIDEVRLVPGGSSWSCSHGVERWTGDCGCTTSSEPGWTQAWRAPLRAALNEVRDRADAVFEELGSEVFEDPWKARDAYIDVLTGRRSTSELMLRPGADDVDHATKLMTLQESAMSMFTSCAWFFADISGIETLQILSYARRTMDLLAELGTASPEVGFLERLAEAKSNIPSEGTGADVFNRLPKGAGPA